MKTNISLPSVKGFSLVELMIAMIISLFLTLGLFTMFRMSSTNVTTTTQFNQLQENGRIALALMERDLTQLGFLGDLTGSPLMASNIIDATGGVAAGIDCIGGGANNASFPNGQSSFRMFWGYEQGVSSNLLACIAPETTTDVLQLKRLIGPSVLATNASRYYAAVSSVQVVFFPGSAAVPVLSGSRVWEYQHHVYFIRNDGTIPILRRRTLSTGNGMNNEEQLVEGIENMRILYGFDANGDNTADSYMPAENVTEQTWDNQLAQRLVSLKIYLLVRASQADNSYTNDVIYRLGDKTLRFTDNFRRKVVSSTIVLENPMLIDVN